MDNSAYKGTIARSSSVGISIVIYFYNSKRLGLGLHEHCPKTLSPLVGKTFYARRPIFTHTLRFPVGYKGYADGAIDEQAFHLGDALVSYWHAVKGLPMIMFIEPSKPSLPSNVKRVQK